MPKLATLTLIGLLTFTFGVAISSRRFVRPRFDRLPLPELSGPPCREGLVSVEPQPQVPIRITVSGTVCNSPQEARVQFVAENIGTVAITKFEIGGIDAYDRPVYGRKGVNRIGSNLYPHYTDTGWIGTSSIADVGGAPVLTNYKLTVWSVTYVDGKTWTRASLK